MKTIILLLTLSLIAFTSAAQSNGGTLGSNTTVCQGNNSGFLSVSGYSGSISRWEYAYSVSGPWTPMIFTANAYNYINLIQSTYFRVVVQLTGYPEALSNSVLVNCDPPSIPGTVSGNTFECVNNPVTTTLSANSGSVIAWEYSTSGWIITNTITTANTIFATLSVLTTTTQIRARVQNGVCPAATSNTLTIIPANNSNGGAISGTQSVCAGSNSVSLSLSNYNGSIIQWESSSSSGGPYSSIASSGNANTVNFTNLNQNIWYRAIVKNGTCPEASSPVFSINVDAASVGGSIVGTQTVCTSVNSGALQLLGHTGQINQWEFSSNSGGSWVSIANTNNILTFSNIPSTYLYRALVQNGLCPTALSTQHTVNVSPAPSATFNVGNTCAVSPAHFTNTTSGNNSYIWDFGNGGSANIYNPTYTFLSSGTYTVKLSATTQVGCTDSIKKTITIYPKPVASFLSSDTACFGSTLLFTNASMIASGSVSQIQFNFSDGSPTTSISPSNHSFMSAGNYPVYITVHSNFGCKDSTFRIINIYPKPNASFVTSNVCRGSASIFNNTSVVSNGSMQHFWNFGNSNFSNAISPNYLYQTAGTFTVSLISSSNHNCKDTTFKAITVNESPNLILTANNNCLGTPIHYSTSVQPSNLNVSVTVNFGDGNFSNSLNPTHLYLSSGTFAASMTAVTDSGCVASSGKNVSVYSKPFANFNFNNVCNADSVTFNNTSSIANGTMIYLWTLSDNATSTLNSPTHFYTAPGNYTVVLIANSNFDCSDTIIKALTIFDAPQADFNFTNACDGFPITFTNTSNVNSGSIAANQWDFGDNSSTTLVHPTKNYLNNGSYTVSLVTLSTNGCRDTVKKSIHVFEGPTANFVVNNHCLNSPVTFSNTSVLNSGTYSSLWEFGDLAKSLLNSPTHLYNKSNSYKVWLKVTSSNSCVDSVSRFVEAYSLPKVTAGKDTSIEKGFGIKLNAIGAQNYNWFPSYGLNNPTLKDPFSNPDSSTTYIVEGIDANGCKNYDTLRVTINDSFLVIPYNIATPDNNGKNDTWIVKNIEAYKENHVIIFDQWNQKVYEKEAYANEWEGKNQQGEILPDATYYYILSFKNTSKMYKGYITLMRNQR